MRYTSVAALLILSVSLDAATLPELDLSRYRHPEELEAYLRQVAAAVPELVSLYSIGQSVEGRELWVAEVSDPSTGKASDKAAIYVDGNLHGNELQGAEVCLHVLDTLLRRRDDPLVDRVVRERVFLIAPIMNPDGRAHFLGEPSTPHAWRNNLRPRDDDHDGRTDEDGYDDLDGDGEILRMRRPLGNDRYEDLGWEGIDNDGDGVRNEDPPGGVDLNRNFPVAWLADDAERDAGPYPLSEPETEAIVRTLLRWPNLAAAQSFHNHGRLLLRPPGHTHESLAPLPPKDLALYDELGGRGQDLLPGFRYLSTYEGQYEVHGSFGDWCYEHLGVITFTCELWDFGHDGDGDGTITERERREHDASALGGTAFVDWRPFEHPELGSIELGGWRSTSLRIPPPSALPELCGRTTRFVLEHADAMPRIVITEVRVQSQSDRLHTIDVTVANRGLLPTATEIARRNGRAVPDRVSVAGRHTTVLASGLLAGGEVILQPSRPETVEVGNLEGGDSVTARFIIEGWKYATASVTSQKGGVAERQFAMGNYELPR